MICSQGTSRSGILSCPGDLAELRLALAAGEDHISQRHVVSEEILVLATEVDASWAISSPPIPSGARTASAYPRIRRRPCAKRFEMKLQTS